MICHELLRVRLKLKDWDVANTNRTRLLEVFWIIGFRIKIYTTTSKNDHFRNNLLCKLGKDLR